MLLDGHKHPSPGIGRVLLFLSCWVPAGHHPKVLQVRGPSLGASSRRTSSRWLGNSTAQVRFTLVPQVPGLHVAWNFLLGWVAMVEQACTLGLQDSMLGMSKVSPSAGNNSMPT